MKRIRSIVAAYALHTGQCYPVRRLFDHLIWHWPVAGKTIFQDLKPTTK